MRLVSVLLVCGLVAGIAKPVVAEIDLKPGMKFENFIRPGTLPTQVPLPPGKWEVASVRTTINNLSTPFLEACLFQESNGKLSKAMWFSVATEARSNGYVQTSFCSRDDMHYRETLSNSSGGNQDCRWVNHFVHYWLDSKTDFSRDCAKVVTERNLELPNHTIVSGFRLADIVSILSVRYYFNPRMEGFEDYPRGQWIHSPWNKTSVNSDSKKRAYIDRIIEWTDKFYPTVKAGFAGKLTAPAGPTPAVAAPPASGPAPVQSVSPAGPTPAVAAPPASESSVARADISFSADRHQRRAEVAANAPRAAEGPALPPAEYKSLPVGTRIEYSDKNYVVTRADGFLTVVKIIEPAASFMNAYGVFGEYGNDLYVKNVKGGGLVEYDLPAESEKSLQAFWPLVVGKETSYQLVELATRDSPRQTWTITLKVLKTEIIEINHENYATYVVEQRAKSDGGMSFTGRKWYHPESGLVLRSKQTGSSDVAIGPWKYKVSRLSQDETVIFSLRDVVFPPGTTANVLAGTGIKTSTN